jgi:hypothetical protein
MKADGDGRWKITNYEFRAGLELDESDLVLGKASDNLKRKFAEQGLTFRDANVISFRLENGEEIWLLTDTYSKDRVTKKLENERTSLGKFTFSEGMGNAWTAVEAKLYLIMKDEEGKLRVYDGRRQTYTVTKLDEDVIKVEREDKLPPPRVIYDVKPYEKLDEDSFKVTEQSLQNLKSKDVPDDVLEKLKSLENREFTGEEKFLGIVKRTIGDEQAVRFKSLILKHAKVPTKFPKNIKVYQYWFYYLFDEGPTSHAHDAEHAFVFVDEFGEVRGVVGAGHTGATANNILVVGRELDTGRQLPENLPKHMPILVELGKHASAPDRSFDGRFDVGMDANLFYADVWGSRDVMTAFGINKIKRVAAEDSFPRNETTLMFEKEYYESLSLVDKTHMKKYKAPINSEFGKGKEIYQLFPLEDMRTLYELLRKYKDLKNYDFKDFPELKKDFPNLNKENVNKISMKSASKK